MIKIGRNDPCPCGSGKKYKKCHQGRGDELLLEQMRKDQSAVGKQIAALPEVHYGRSGEFVEGLNIEDLTGKKMGITFVDFSDYMRITGEHQPQKRVSASQIINTNRTAEHDPDNIYVAITPDINESTLIHQLAHVVGFLRGSFPLPGEQILLAEQQQVPAEHVDHPQEFGELLVSLHEQFDIELDAEDWIIAYLARNEVLIPSEEIAAGDTETLLYRSAMVLTYLQEHREEIDEQIKSRDGYVGKQG